MNDQKLNDRYGMGQRRGKPAEVIDLTKAINDEDDDSPTNRFGSGILGVRTGAIV